MRKKIIVMLVLVTLLIIIGTRYHSKYYEDSGIREISTKCEVLQKGIDEDNTRYIIVNHIPIEDYGIEERIEIDSRMVWNLIEEDRIYRMTYKIHETHNELTEIWSPREK